MAVKTEKDSGFIFTGTVTDLGGKPELNIGPVAEYMIPDRETMRPDRKPAGATGFKNAAALEARLTDRKTQNLPCEQTEKALQALREYKPS